MHIYTRNARVSGIQFDLTLEDFKNIIFKDCTYCGAKPKNVSERNRNLRLHNGIDRMDNSMGYFITNIVPCCSVCNSIKGKFLTYSQMLQVGHILRITKKPIR